ncbi:MAG: hypothetical protein K2R98_19910 [Gemmataceae bacterium]|nr:hypothetical protein [Gemmataceae bacterium]
MRLANLNPAIGPSIGIQLQIASDNSTATCTCLVCALTWKAPASSSGELELAWWLCPRGCNGDWPEAVIPGAGR